MTQIGSHRELVIIVVDQVGPSLLLYSVHVIGLLPRVRILLVGPSRGLSDHGVCSTLVSGLWLLIE